MILDKFRLTDRVAVVTGSGQGIGRGIALALAEAGAHIVVAERNPDTAARTAAEIQKLGRRALVASGDLRRRDDVDAAVRRTVDEFTRIDVLVNNVGGGFSAPTLDLSENGWDAILNVNLKPAFLCSKAIVPIMREHGGGAIVNIASVAGLEASAGRPPYGAAKAGIISLTQSWAVEWAPYRVRVNAVAPGGILSGPAAEDVWPTEEDRARAAARVPLGRMGRPEDIAAAALFLASDAAEWITGVTLRVDGGPPPRT